MKRNGLRFLTLIFCLLFVLTGCGVPVTGVLNGPNPFGDPEKTELLNKLLETVEPEYNTGWPENAFTAHIPCPEVGTVDHIYDYSPAGRFEVALNEITQEQAKAYIDQLDDNGWAVIASSEEEYSAGTMLKKDDEEVYLNIAFSDNAIGILITDESLATDFPESEE